MLQCMGGGGHDTPLRAFACGHDAWRLAAYAWAGSWEPAACNMPDFPGQPRSRAHARAAKNMLETCHHSQAAQEKAVRQLCAMRCPGSVVQHSRQACAPSATCSVPALNGNLPLGRHTSALSAVRRLRYRQLGNVRSHAP